MWIGYGKIRFSVLLYVHSCPWLHPSSSGGAGEWRNTMVITSSTPQGRPIAWQTLLQTTLHELGHALGMQLLSLCVCVLLLAHSTATAKNNRQSALCLLLGATHLCCTGGTSCPQTESCSVTSAKVNADACRPRGASQYLMHPAITAGPNALFFSTCSLATMRHTVNELGPRCFEQVDECHFGGVCCDGGLPVAQVRRHGRGHQLATHILLKRSNNSPCPPAHLQGTLCRQAVGSCFASATCDGKHRGATLRQ